LKVFFLPFLSGAAAPVPAAAGVAGFAIVNPSRYNQSSVVSLRSSANRLLIARFPDN
jgi:hypothetical protein